MDEIPIRELDGRLVVAPSVGSRTSMYVGISAFTGCGIAVGVLTGAVAVACAVGSALATCASAFACWSALLGRPRFFLGVWSTADV